MAAEDGADVEGEAGPTLLSACVFVYTVCACRAAPSVSGSDGVGAAGGGERGGGSGHLC